MDEGSTITFGIAASIVDPACHDREARPASAGPDSPVAAVPRVADCVTATTTSGPFQLARIGPGPRGMRVKRCFDLVVATTVAVPALPLAALIGLLIKLTTRGPVLFRQVRVGLHGQHFEILKFRTMVRDADARKVDLLGNSEADGLFKIRRDPRLTRIGAVLRQSYLDELPQLINVLKGNMSIVGPRPLIPEEDAAIHGSGRVRLQVPPGMTGEWQLLRGGGASLDELIAIDFRYVTEWSIWRDVRCLVKTAERMIASAGW